MRAHPTQALELTISPRKIVFGYPALLSALLIFCFALFIYRDKLNAPPQPFDAADYENIAFNLFNHNQFAHDVSDPVWRAPYVIYQDSDSPYAKVLDKTIDASGSLSFTAYRAPLLPWLISVSYRIWGRSFSAWRLVNCLLLSLALGAVCYLAAILGGKLGYALCLSALLFDFDLLAYGFEYLTEALSIVLVVLLLAVSSQPLNKRSPYWLGGLIGLLILLKSSFSFIGLAVLLYSFIRERHKAGARRALLLSSVVALLTSAPWMIRNLSLLPGFMPFGTQPGIDLAIGYSDGILANKGLWSASIDRTAHPLMSERDMSLEGEIQRSQYGFKAGSSWVEENISKLPNLVWVKVWSLWIGNATLRQKILGILGIAGVIVSGPTLISGSSLAILFGQTLTVGLSHNVGGGRFLLPLYPVLYLFAAVAVALLLQSLQRKIF